MHFTSQQLLKVHEDKLKSVACRLITKERKRGCRATFCQIGRKHFQFRPCAASTDAFK
uniref:Uncharacterized protein n=1 Tax=Arundo donax TaxID=35708 RepID=A0A0A9DD94_ARUDO